MKVGLRRQGLAAAVAGLVLLSAGCASRPPPPPVREDALARWGVEVVSLRRSAAGFLLDFRFRVLDAQKAAPLFARRLRPYLVDPASGERFQVPSPPKVGALRQTPHTAEGNRTYFILFANPGRRLQPGARVTVVLGDCEARDVQVE